MISGLHLVVPLAPDKYYVFRVPYMIFHFVLVVVRRTRAWSHFFTHFSFTVDMLDLH